jgi:cytochrome c553
MVSQCAKCCEVRVEHVIALVISAVLLWGYLLIQYVRDGRELRRLREEQRANSRTTTCALCHSVKGHRRDCPYATPLVLR